MEIRNLAAQLGQPVRVILFDFDGTISTLRAGWESVMRTQMLRWLGKGRESSEELIRRVDAYIDESTGIQTIHQMKWLAAEAQRMGIPGAPADPWIYKAEYNEMLMETVARKRDEVMSGAVPGEKYRIAGALEFLAALKERGVRLCVASGTDHPDVVREAEALGVSQYFDSIAGAAMGEESCSKEAVMRRLMEEEGMQGSQVAVIGDGRVEIALGKEYGARTVGMATDERALRGVNPVKRERLIRAGADAISGDFTEKGQLMAFLGMEGEWA